MFFLFRNFAEVKRKDDEKDLCIVAGHVAGIAGIGTETEEKEAGP